jgi:predicted enzyme related to lactoylglutathione lyase
MKLAGLNVWSTAPESVAGVLNGALGIALKSREGDRGQHFTGRAGELMVSIHPSEKPGVELAFVVDAIDSAVEACRSQGATVISGPEREPYGVSAHLQGPDEIRIELVQISNEDKG